MNAVATLIAMAVMEDAVDTVETVVVRLIPNVQVASKVANLKTVNAVKVNTVATSKNVIMAVQKDRTTVLVLKANKVVAIFKPCQSA